MSSLKTFIAQERGLSIQRSRLEIDDIVVVVHSLRVLHNFIMVSGLIDKHGLHWCTAILLILGVLIQLHRLLHCVIRDLLVTPSRLLGLIVSCVVEHVFIFGLASD